jgi:hypothetical protein
MRDAIHWQEVPCGVCGDVLPKHQAQFAPTGLAHDYRCWVCAAKENSPNLQREEAHAQRLQSSACAPYPEDDTNPAVRAVLPLIGIALSKFIVALFGNL